MKTKLLFCSIIALMSCFTMNSQTEAERKYAIESFKEQAEEVKSNLINDVCAELNLDEFETQIVSQTMYSYFNEIQRIYAMKIEALEKQELRDILDRTHFKDLESILEKHEIDFILNQIKGDWKKNQKQLKKKRKKRKKKTKN